ncbi:MAG: S8 family serine peptidase [Nakamurella multipartita]
MILYNPSLADVETDNHWLPTVHLADGTAFLAYLGAHPDATASFTAGVKANGQGDVMAAFSSRGPAGSSIKPDLTAPGVRSWPGRRPLRSRPPRGPRPVLQAIAGTSMSSPRRQFGRPAAPGPAPGLDAGPDQVGPDDDRDHQGGPGTPPRPIRSTWGPDGST